MNPPNWNVTTTIVLAVACIALLSSHATAQTEPMAVRIGYVGSTETSAYLGAKQGLIEANAQGEFLGQTYHLEVFSLAGVPDGLSAIVAALPKQHLYDLAYRFPDTPIFNISAYEDELREACLPNLLHVIPSRAMLADARRQWQIEHPESAAKAQTWHPSFRKYAASQLNLRYTESAAGAMDDVAWAGWAAVKLLSNTIARESTAKASALLEAMKSNLAFDGQKGIDMSFRETGQLSQPLLLVEDGKIVGEAPVRGVVNTTNLDSLGLSHCPK